MITHISALYSVIMPLAFIPYQLFLFLESEIFLKDYIQLFTDSTLNKNCSWKKLNKIPLDFEHIFFLLAKF